MNSNRDSVRRFWNKEVCRRSAMRTKRLIANCGDGVDGSHPITVIFRPDEALSRRSGLAGGVGIVRAPPIP
jgi:hypothetical protein